MNQELDRPGSGRRRARRSLDSEGPSSSSAIARSARSISSAGALLAGRARPRSRAPARTAPRGSRSQREQARGPTPSARPRRAARGSGARSSSRAPAGGPRRRARRRTREPASEARAGRAGPQRVEQPLAQRATGLGRSAIERSLPPARRAQSEAVGEALGQPRAERAQAAGAADHSRWRSAPLRSTSARAPPSSAAEPSRSATGSSSSSSAWSTCAGGRALAAAQVGERALHPVPARRPAVLLDPPGGRRVTRARRHRGARPARPPARGSPPRPRPPRRSWSGRPARAARASRGRGAA